MSVILLCPFDPVTEKELLYAREIVREQHLSEICLVPWGRGILSAADRQRLLEAAVRPFSKLNVLKTMHRDDTVIRMEDCEEDETKIRSGAFYLAPKPVRRILIEEGLYFEEVARACCRPKRFAHSVSVAKTAVRLAEAHHLDCAKAWKAGILHDVTKAMPEDEARAIIAEGKPEWLQLSPKIWHSYTASVWIRKNMGNVGSDILHAIEHHTLGDGTTDLDRIIYISDKIEPTRDYNVSRETELALKDLKKAAALVLRESKEYILKTEGKHV